MIPPPYPPSPPPGQHPEGWIEGIDVSKWQSRIDWVRAYNDGGVRFAWIKASEALFEDGAYRGHVTNAMRVDSPDGKSAGDIFLGAYHFLRNDVDPIKQAERFASLIPIASELPPMLDVEHAYFDHKSPPPWAQITDASKRIEAHAHACASEVERLTGRRVVIYTGPYYFAHRTDTLANGRPLFVAQYYQRTLTANDRPKLPLAWSDWAVWQWAGDDGRVEGVEGPCDRNYFQGDRDALERFCLASILGQTTEVLPTHDEANTEQGAAWRMFRAYESLREDYSDEQDTFHDECFNFGMNRGRDGCE